MNVPAHRILCIEDDARLRRLLTEDLTDAGYQLLAAPDARSGLKAYFDYAPALVLCDIRMPGVSGFDLLERLRRLDADLFGTAFIFLTALADRDNQLRGRRLGADDYITKPVDYEILREIVRIRLSGREPSAAPPELDNPTIDALEKWFDAYPAVTGLPDVAALEQRFRNAAGRQVQSEPELFETMANSFPLGVLIIDAHGMLRYVNESAASILGRPLPDLTGTRAPSPLLNFVREHAFSERARTGGFSAARVLVAADGQPTTAVARSMRRGESGANASVAVVLPKLPASPPALSGLLRTLFDLTPAEELVATQVGGGSNLADVAEGRGVALATVRSQLKTVFDKMGVTRQSDLVRDLLSLRIAAGFTDV